MSRTEKCVALVCAIVFVVYTTGLIIHMANQEEEVIPQKPVITVIDHTTEQLLSKNIPAENVEKKTVEKDEPVQVQKPAPKNDNAPAEETKAKPEVKSEVEPVKTYPVSPAGEHITIYNMVNSARRENGLAPLALDQTLCQVAAIRADEISNKWSHTRPDGSDFGALLKGYSYSFARAGENLGKSWDCTRMSGLWMDSEGHRKVMLGEYTKTGVGVVKRGGIYYAVQIFAR